VYLLLGSDRLLTISFIRSLRRLVNYVESLAGSSRQTFAFSFLIAESFYCKFGKDTLGILLD
jgi:hypothetical protein